MKGIGIEVLLKEHENILKFIELVKKSCIELMNGQDIDMKRFREYINFSRYYADRHHHGKEEAILFKMMVEELGGVAENLVKHGMLVEHDLGRLFVMDLEHALNEFEDNPNDDNRIQIIANAVGYGNLLKRHIEKENNAVYTFAQRELTEEQMKRVDESTLVFEEESKEDRVFYENWLEALYKEV